MQINIKRHDKFSQESQPLGASTVEAKSAAVYLEAYTTWKQVLGMLCRSI
jgi:hypothetical protein